jgi:hypothetical protein
MNRTMKRDSKSARRHRPPGAPVYKKGSMKPAANQPADNRKKKGK